MCKEAIACFKETINGTIVFHECIQNNGITVIFDLRGPPNKEFACHIHSFGDLRQGCSSLGSHWNPFNTTHGYTFDTSRPSHAGDLVGNINIDNKGFYQFLYKDPKITLHGDLSIVGRSVVIHSGVDDLGRGGNAESLITGNAGGRMDCAVIGWANPDTSATG